MVLLLAFLLSAWGNVIAAAFCPRYLANRECSVKPISQETQQIQNTSSCHHQMAEMADMQMDETDTRSAADADTADNVISEAGQFEAVSQTSGELTIDVPAEPCGHCWMHSQPASGTATLVAVDPSKQLIDTIAPPAEAAVNVPSHVVVPISPVEHGPPGNLLPRYVLINVFRI
jgi:hypothetical protein